MWSRKISKHSPNYSNNISNIPSHDCSFAVGKMDKDGKKAALGAAIIIEADHNDENKSNGSKNGSNVEVSTKIEDQPSMSGTEGVFMKLGSSDFLLRNSLLNHTKEALNQSGSRENEGQLKETGQSNDESPKMTKFSLQINPKIELKSNKNLLNKLELSKFMTTFKAGVTKKIGTMLDKNPERLNSKPAHESKTYEIRRINHSASLQSDVVTKKGGIKTVPLDKPSQSGSDHRRTNSDTFKLQHARDSNKDEAIMCSARVLPEVSTKLFQPFKTQQERSTNYEPPVPSESIKMHKKHKKSQFKSDDSTKEFRKINSANPPSRKAIGKKIPLVMELEKEVKDLKKENTQLKAENLTIKKVALHD